MVVNLYTITPFLAVFPKSGINAEHTFMVRPLLLAQYRKHNLGVHRKKIYYLDSAIC